ncbi:MAG: general secretion pathway protein GspB [Deltaproteobacteria bacterium]|nr:general secretion pathway protein GspB [Deltaproteobacteria bacterium]MBW1738314.1 general secretion pathway protein GspB [Deltaproteobacteria bacterium]MBW1907953.1 general secretion pathway protein GspB [Deltaproteobacteria bacterium]MBW2033226.1 general secretion pathway protein GspB [Deltaproteobacteria bacterium]MBW2113709.1 general secretion pathway protein GspB [Deltaproteobacteria bacterium]
MSSILKALKKLEKEFPQQDEAVSWPQKIYTKKAISKHAKGTWRFNKFISVFFVTVILAAGVWLILSQKPLWMKEFFPGTSLLNQNGEEGKTASIPVRKKVKKGPVPVSRTETVPEKQPSGSVSEISRQDLPQRDTGAAKNSEKYDRVKKVEKRTAAPVRRPLENTLKPVSRSLSETEISRPGLHKRETFALKEVEKPGPDKIVEDTKSIPARVMDDSRLELQAIAWSIDAKKRIAVINGRVVREGATIDGVSIARIGKDEVVVLEGKELWKLVFTIK